MSDDDLCPDAEDVDERAEYLAHLEALAPWGTSRSGLKEWAEG